jgi:hypothetical protein
MEASDVHLRGLPLNTLLLYQHTSACAPALSVYVRIRSCSISIRQLALLLYLYTSAYAPALSAYVSIRSNSISIRQHALLLYQHTSAYVSDEHLLLTYADVCSISIRPPAYAPALSTYVRIRQLRASFASQSAPTLSAYIRIRIRSCSISIRPHTSATSMSCLSICYCSYTSSLRPHTLVA